MLVPFSQLQCHFTAKVKLSRNSRTRHSTFLAVPKGLATALLSSLGVAMGSESGHTVLTTQLHT